MDQKLAHLTKQLSDSVERYSSMDPQSLGYADAKNEIAEVARAIHNLTGGPIGLRADRAPVLFSLLSIRLFMDWGVFDHIPLNASISYEKLASLAEADVDIISKLLARRVDKVNTCIARLSWMLVSTGLLTQIGPDHVAHTSRSKSLLGEDNPLAATTKVLYV